MLKIILVPVIMVCALGGTVGLLKIIQKITPGDGFPNNSVSKKLNEEVNHFHER